MTTCHRHQLWRLRGALGLMTGDHLFPSPSAAREDRHVRWPLPPRKLSCCLMRFHFPSKGGPGSNICLIKGVGVLETQKLLLVPPFSGLYRSQNPSHYRAGIAVTLPPRAHLRSAGRFRGRKAGETGKFLRIPSDFALGVLAWARLSHDSPALECFVSQSLICFKPLKCQANNRQGTGRRVASAQA